MRKHTMTTSRRKEETYYLYYFIKTLLAIFLLLAVSELTTTAGLSVVGVVPSSRRKSVTRTTQQSLLLLRRASASFLSSMSQNNNNNNNHGPVLVVGATGRVGRRVVQQLMGQNIPVKALVRDPVKALNIFGTSTGFMYPSLEIIVADIAQYHLYTKELNDAVQNCQAIISVSGVVRFAQWTDFIFPWRILNFNVTNWATYDHPYYGNYMGQLYLIELAKKYHISRFVRLTGLSLAYSAFNGFSILFNTLLSISNRWNSLCERALIQSGIPYVILRPGGLADNIRDTNQTHVQIDPSGKLPFAGRIGRDDVAALCVSAVMELPINDSHILACRWCGDNIKPKSQGRKEDGYGTAQECMQQLASVGPLSTSVVPPRMKPYGAVVLVTVYTLVAITIKALSWIGKILFRLLLG